jgi:outer membrane immunogenic protein
MPSWTGCYVGANVGGAFGQTDFHRVGKVNGAVLSDDFGSQSPSSVAGGGQAGCDYQVGHFVFGAQGLIDGAGLDGSNVVTAFPNFTMHSKNDWYATVAGRIGYTLIPVVLVYGKAGVAFTHDRFANNGRTFLSETADADRTGWTAGAGVEWMILPHFSVSLEYQHMDFGSKTVAFTAAPGTIGSADVIAVKQQIDTVMAGVNYHFKP